MPRDKSIAIVDLFSGPGGLGEGFSAVRDDSGQPYKIAVSIEKETSAHRTLRLRAFLRRFSGYPAEYYAWLESDGREPDWAMLYPEQWEEAKREALCLELGSGETAHILQERIRTIRARHGGRTLLIGGPPCQAYSLVGRARNSGNSDYRAELDHRNFLYDEYVKVLCALSPAVFVMENVKGMLSAAVSGNPIFEQVMSDLRNAGGPDRYQLFALSSDAARSKEPRPQDFVVRSELFGVPQARHRVIIVGVRRDIADKLTDILIPRIEPRDYQVTVSMVLGGMPQMRSGLSRDDTPGRWREIMASAVGLVENAVEGFEPARSAAFRAELRKVAGHIQVLANGGRAGRRNSGFSDDCPDDLRDWIGDPLFAGLPQNETRGHMPSDLVRYLFASCYGKIFGTSPKASQFPSVLAPNHRNWASGKFNDRFRVQLGGRPSSTVTSHIAKDGHYFIHPDPLQCRSLTVREAARLQTFPDNYAFLGNRTQQYVQVGNAVPPFLAWQIAKSILPIFELA